MKHIFSHNFGLLRIKATTNKFTKMKSAAILFVFLSVCLIVAHANILPEPSPRAVKNLNNGLYEIGDKVVILSGSYAMWQNVVGKRYASLVQFYNSFCGHCRRFAPAYKEFANDIYTWRDNLKVMVIDCAQDENKDVCRNYEVISWPLLKYFSPNYEKGEKQVGMIIQSLDPNQLITLLMNETSSDESWPDFSPLTDSSKLNIYKNVSPDIMYTLIIYDTENSTLAGEMILQFYRFKSVKILRTLSSEVAHAFEIDTFNTIAVVKRNFELDTISVPNVERALFIAAIFAYFRNHSILPTSDSEEVILKATTTHGYTADNELLYDVKKQPYLVYQADLEHAARYALFHEIPKYPEISGERLLVLQRFINILTRYNPLGNNGHRFLDEVKSYIYMHNQNIDGESFQTRIRELEKEFTPIFSTSKWVGCQSLKPGLRRFPCGLWQLFHYMTVQASEDEKSYDPLEVLQGVHGYVKYFFGCSDCSNHFQTMAARNRIWGTTSKDNAVLWLWSAHNEVNQRLAGDITEDPEFPKVQFPTNDVCEECYRDTTDAPSSNHKINWDKMEVLNFLKRIHNPANISHLGVDDETVLPPVAEKLRTKRMLGIGAFSDIDIRMGLFLYGFCIIMMIVAVKLFVKKGYKKKPYSHDFLGKV